MDNRELIHSYLVERAPISDVSNIINDLMMCQPSKKHQAGVTWQKLYKLPDDVELIITEK